MSKEEFMALTAEEMYNKYKVADEAVWCEFEVRIRRAEEMITMLWRD